jgi:hypothetical protein
MIKCIISLITIVLFGFLIIVPTFATIINVPGTSDIWLAGMPNGSVASINDSAPGQSPVLVPGLTLAPGNILTFGSSGLVANGPALTLVGPDGDPTWWISHLTGVENGISDINSQINALIGVFLGPSQPDLSSAPTSLDFGLLGINFTSLSPELKQVFFIGDGFTGTGSGTMQNFVVPAGATRLFLGTMDGYEWNNNIGSFDVTINQTTPIPEPSTLLLLGSSLIGFAGYAKIRFIRKNKKM